MKDLSQIFVAYSGAANNNFRFRYNKLNSEYFHHREVERKLRFLTVSPGAPTPPMGPSIPMSPCREGETTDLNKHRINTVELSMTLVTWLKDEGGRIVSYLDNQRSISQTINNHFYPSLF